MTSVEIEKGFQEIWRLFKETDSQFKETDKKLAETIKAVGNLTGKWSKFVEGLIAPSVEKMFKKRGIVVDRVYQRVKAHQNSDSMEIDILAVDEEYAVVIEAKSTLRIEDVNDHVARLKNFKRFFPEYKDRKVIGAIGGISIEEDSDRYAYKQGMFVITEKGENARILNDKGFKPKVW